MAKIYKIRDGFSFVMGDGTVKAGGETIELEDDVAQNHSHKLELYVAPTTKVAGTKKPVDEVADPAPDASIDSSIAPVNADADADNSDADPVQPA